MNFSIAFEGTRASCKAHVDPASACRFSMEFDNVTLGQTKGCLVILAA